MPDVVKSRFISLDMVGNGPGGGWQKQLAALTGMPRNNTPEESQLTYHSRSSRA
jgi:hypothetical protein